MSKEYWMSDVFELPTTPAKFWLSPANRTQEMKHLVQALNSHDAMKDKIAEQADRIDSLRNALHACAQKALKLRTINRVARDALDKDNTTPSTQGDEWVSVEDRLPENCIPVQVNIESTYRYKKYSPKSMQYRMGLAGRWQEFNGYGGWDNCEAPNQWKPQPPQGKGNG